MRGVSRADPFSSCGSDARPCAAPRGRRESVPWTVCFAHIGDQYVASREFQPPAFCLFVDAFDNSAVPPFQLDDVDKHMLRHPPSPHRQDCLRIAAGRYLDALVSPSDLRVQTGQYVFEPVLDTPGFAGVVSQQGKLGRGLRASARKRLCGAWGELFHGFTRSRLGIGRMRALVPSGRLVSGRVEGAHSGTAKGSKAYTGSAGGRRFTAPAGGLPCW
jgi:hypothetical protein